MNREPSYDELTAQLRQKEEELAACKHAQGKLLKSQYYLDRITNGMFESLVIIDREFMISEVNDRFLEEYGTTRDKVIGRPCYEVTHGEDQRCSSADHPCPAAQVFQTGKPVRVEHLHRTLSGGELTVEIYAFPLFGKDGGVEQVVEVQHDVTSRKRAEQERILREKLDGVVEMAGAVCHELNQPLQAVSAYAETLQAMVPEDDPLHERIRKMTESVRRMIDISRKLQNITSYQTKDYVRGKRIVDIDKASGPR